MPVDVEVSISRGTPARVTTVGLPAHSARESLARVRAALWSSGCYFTQQRLTINLAPADIRKVGPVYALPIAVGLPLVTGQMEASIRNALFIGEL